MPVINNVGEVAKPKITPEILKMSKTLECSCGGMIFTQAIVVKKISAIISPSGKEEFMPIDVMICDRCKKVNRELLQYDILPEDVMEVPRINLNTSTTPNGPGFLSIQK